MEKLTISMVIFNSFLYVYQRVHTPYEMIKSPSVMVQCWLNVGSKLAGERNPEVFGLTSDTEPPVFGKSEVHADLSCRNILVSQLGEDEESTPCRGHPTVLVAMGNPKNRWRFTFAKVIELYYIYRAMFDDTGGQPAFEFVKIDSDWPHD